MMNGIVEVNSSSKALKVPKLRSTQRRRCNVIACRYGPWGEKKEGLSLFKVPLPGGRKRTSAKPSNLGSDDNGDDEDEVIMGLRKKRRAEWLQKMGLPEDNKTSLLVCSEHFISGNPSLNFFNQLLITCI
jgi:hypothetical protein